MTLRELKRKIRKFKGCDNLQIRVLNNTHDLEKAKGIDDVFIVKDSSGESNAVYVFYDETKE